MRFSDGFDDGRGSDHGWFYAHRLWFSVEVAVFVLEEPQRLTLKDGALPPIQGNGVVLSALESDECLPFLDEYLERSDASLEVGVYGFGGVEGQRCSDHDN